MNEALTPRGGDRRHRGTGLSPQHRRWMVFFAVVIGLAGVAFCVKLYEFFYDLASQQDFRFAGAHLVTYLLVAGGFFLLLAFAFLSGHFSDIERPKHELLDAERRYDRDEFGP